MLKDSAALEEAEVAGVRAWLCDSDAVKVASDAVKVAAGVPEGETACGDVSICVALGEPIGERLLV